MPLKKIGEQEIRRVLLTKSDQAFTAYADTGRSLIAKGDPVGDPGMGRKLVWQLREMADRQGKRCDFYAVSPAYLPTFLDTGLSILKIGELTRVDLAGFTLDCSARKGLRRPKAAPRATGWFSM